MSVNSLPLDQIIHTKNCKQIINKNEKYIKCSSCKKLHHQKCHKIYARTRYQINNWKRWSCLNVKAIKCKQCKKTIARNLHPVQCTICKKNFHKKCAKLPKNICNNWNCQDCTGLEFPFCNLSNEEFISTINGIDNTDKTKLNLLPSFSVQTLLDKITSDVCIETGGFESETVNSKYYAPNEFLARKFAKSKFSILHLNIVSLQSRINELRELLALLNYPFDLIAISETKLKTDCDIAVNIDLDGYDFEKTTTDTFFGGVAIYIRKSLKYSVRKELSFSNKNMAESIFVEIERKNKKNIIAGCIYRHHGELQKFNDTFLSKILKKMEKHKNKTMFLCGDFNANLLAAEEHSDTGAFYEDLACQSFQPLILQPTRVTSHSATLIDNIFCNDLTVHTEGGNLTTSISDHFPQFSIIDNINNEHQKDIPISRRSYKNFNTDEFENELRQIDWVSLLENKTSEEAVNFFFNKINMLLDEMAPYKRLNRKERKSENSPWITRGIIKSITNRDKLHNLYLKEHDATKKAELFSKFKRIRNILSSLIKQAKSDYYKELFEENKSNIKQTWKEIKKIVNLNKKNKVFPESIKKGHHIIHDKKDIANEFNTYFTSIGNNIDDKIPHSEKNFKDYLTNQHANQFRLTLTTPLEITKIIISIKLSKASGPNSIQTKLLKDCIDTFSFIISMLINKSFSEGSFPDFLKLANVIPIFKKNDKNICGNYRPISLLSNISKIYERVFHTQLYNFFDDNNLFYHKQYGFRKKHSTEHALLTIVENIKNNTRKKLFSCGTFIDLEKAFDTVNHKILLQKLSYYGVKGNALHWLHDYLTNRKQCVILDETSPYLPITCGVPQGSILGPLLFIIYINDMHKAVLNSNIHHFADDTNLIYSCKNIKTLRKKMNEDLKCIYTWLCANRLSINVGKTEFILFKPSKCKLEERFTLKFNSITIFESKKLRYLGIILDDKLSWKYHIHELTKKLSRATGIINRLKENSVPTKALLSVYSAIFQSHLNFGLSVWGQAHEVYLQKIRTIQNKVMRKIANADYDTDITDIYKQTNVLKLTDLFKTKIMSLMWDFDHNILPISLNEFFSGSNDHQYETRTAESGMIQLNSNFRTANNKSFAFLGTKTLNEMKNNPIYNPILLKKTFTSNIKKEFISNY